MNEMGGAKVAKDIWRRQRPRLSMSAHDKFTQITGTILRAHLKAIVDRNSSLIGLPKVTTPRYSIAEQRSSVLVGSASLNARMSLSSGFPGVGSEAAIGE